MLFWDTYRYGRLSGTFELDRPSGEVLLVSQRNHRIQSAGPACWEQTGQEPCRAQHNHYTRNGQWIGDRYLEDFASKKPGKDEAPHEAGAELAGQY